MQDNSKDALRALDAFSQDFVHEAQYPTVATRDLGRLGALAKQVIDDLEGWGDRIKALDCASLYNLDRAILLVLESVFDELLTLEACRVMEAEISFRRSLR